MKYFVVFAAVCICAFAGTYNPSPVDWCSFYVETDFYVDGTFNSEGLLAAMKKGDTIVASSHFYLSGSSVTTIIRGDLMDSSKKIPVVTGEESNIKRDSDQCEVEYMSQDEAKKELNYIAGGIFYPFEYKTEEDEELTGTECTKYCNDDEECVYVKKECDTNCVYAHSFSVDDAARSSKTSIMFVYIYYGESNDMSDFALDADYYPGCEDDAKVAYIAPDNICLDYYTFEAPYCAYSVETVETYSGDPNPYNPTKLYMMSKDDVVVGAALDEDGTKYVLRGDKMDKTLHTPVFIGYPDYSTKCVETSLSYYEMMGRLVDYAGPLFSSFPYEGAPHDTEFNGTKCDQYCNSYGACLYVKKDCKKGCIIAMSHPDYRRSSSIVTVYFNNYEKVEDMSLFSLSKDEFPGCSEEGLAYKAPESLCGSDSAGSVVKSAAVLVIAAIFAALF